MTKRKFCPAEEQEIGKIYDVGGFTTRHVARAYKTSKSTIGDVVKRVGRKMHPAHGVYAGPSPGTRGLNLPHREALAWAAGFIDGDGCFMTYSTTDTRRENIGQVYNYIRPRFQLSQSSVSGVPNTITRLKEIFPFGVIGGPYTKATEKTLAKKPRYALRFDGFEKVQYAVAAMWTWLSCYRKNQAKRVLLAYINRGPTKI